MYLQLPWPFGAMPSGWGTDQQDGAVLANLNVEDDPPFVPRTQNSGWTPLLAAIDDETLQPAANFPLSHDEPWVPAVQAQPWTPVAATYEEMLSPLANFALEDDPFIPAPPAALPSPRVATDTEELGILPLTAVEQEDAFPLAPMPSYSGVVYRDDETGSPLANLPVEDDPPFVARLMAGAWTPVALTDEDALSIVPPAPAPFWKSQFGTGRLAGTENITGRLPNV